MPRAIQTRLGLVMFCLGVALPGAAATAPFYWQALDVAIDVEETGDLLVTERQTYVFTAPHRTKRLHRIPLAQADAITDIRVFEEGRELAVSAKRSRNQVRIRWRQRRQTPERQTFVVQYRVKGGVRLHPQGDQIVWPALFADRDAPIQGSTVTVRVPEILAGQIRDMTH